MKQFSQILGANVQNQTPRFRHPCFKLTPYFFTMNLMARLNLLLSNDCLDFKDDSFLRIFEIEFRMHVASFHVCYMSYISHSTRLHFCYSCVVAKRVAALSETCTDFSLSGLRSQLRSPNATWIYVCIASNIQKVKNNCHLMSLPLLPVLKEVALYFTFRTFIKVCSDIQFFNKIGSK